MINVNEEVFQTISENIKKYRTSLGYSIEKLAEISNLDINYLKKLEDGGVDGSITVGILELIADSLDIPLNKLLKDEKH